MTMICKCNAGFEDLLTIGQRYPVMEVGENSYLIKSDNGCYKWLGTAKFQQERL